MFGSHGLDPLSMARDRRKVRRMIQLAADADGVCLRETRGGRADLTELSHFLPTFTFTGSFTLGGASFAVAFVVSAAFADRYTDSTIMRGRIAILRCRGANVPPIDIVNADLVDTHLGCSRLPSW